MTTLMDLNRTRPKIPDELMMWPELDISARTEILEQLWNDIWAELNNPEYATRNHHTRGTYDDGCRGPMCTKANRDNPRRKQDPLNSMPLRAERMLDAVAEFYHVIAKHRIKEYKRHLLERIRGGE